MKIAVLNECFLSSENIAYLKSIGDVKVFKHTKDEQTAIKRLAGKDIAFADMYDCPLNANVLSQTSGLKLLCINSTSFDRVDLNTASENKILVTNTPGFSTESVAEHAFALLGAVNRRIVTSVLANCVKPFQVNPSDTSHYEYRGTTLFGKTFGIIGLGAVGIYAARIAQGYGMKVIAYNRSPKSIEGIAMVSLDELYSHADVISLHVPLNDDSKNIIDANSLKKMKKNCIIINTARGGCIVSKDLSDAINNHEIAGAGLDIVNADNLSEPMFQTINTVITPHTAWFTNEALGKIGNIMTENVRQFVDGKPCNVISA